MEYVYAAMWFVIGLILIFRMSKENKVFYLAGGFFILLGGWWMANAMLPIKMFEGNWGMALRVITGAALLVMCVVFFKEQKRNSQKSRLKDKPNQESEKQENTEAEVQNDGSENS